MEVPFFCAFPLKPLIRSGNGELLVLAALLHVVASSGESAEKELLGQACANPFGGADRKISEDHPGTTIGSGIVKVPEG
jgi:hypothetical protein